jgi:hypothetical protein
MKLSQKDIDFIKEAAWKHRLTTKTFLDVLPAKMRRRQAKIIAQWDTSKFLRIIRRLRRKAG